MDKTNTDYWSNLKESFMDYIRKQKIQPRKHKDYSRNMNLLIEYASKNGCNEYSPKVGTDFYESEKCCNYKGNTTLGRRRAAIRHLNQHLYGETFWMKKPRHIISYPKRPAPQCPEQFVAELEAFLTNRKNDGLKEITLDNYRRSCIKMLCDFNDQGVKNWKSINAKNLTTAFSRTTSDKKTFITHARCFFRYLVSAGVVINNYTDVLPQLNKRKVIPCVYSREEIKQLLESIERFTPTGKRNYAIVLVSARLGLRASDIRLLKFENVDFENSVVKFIQFKTSIANQLPLSEELVDALHDYIDNGREESNEPYIFLDGHGRPLLPNAVSSIVSWHFNHSGIDISNRRNHSTTALRMSFASRLIEEKVPYEVVRVALGHSNPRTTRAYVQFDMESLRTCALDVPPPSGMLSKYLAGGE